MTFRVIYGIFNRTIFSTNWCGPFAATLYWADVLRFPTKLTTLIALQIHARYNGELDPAACEHSKRHRL